MVPRIVRDTNNCNATVWYGRIHGRRLKFTALSTCTILYSVTNLPPPRRSNVSANPPSKKHASPAAVHLTVTLHRTYTLRFVGCSAFESNNTHHRIASLLIAST